MSTAELKLKLELINKITELKEVRIINEIKKLLDFELDEEIFELSAQQKERIAKAKKEYTLNQTFSNEDVENEMEQWLNEK